MNFLVASWFAFHSCSDNLVGNIDTHFIIVLFSSQLKEQNEFVVMLFAFWYGKVISVQVWWSDCTMQVFGLWESQGPLNKISWSWTFQDQQLLQLYYGKAHLGIPWSCGLLLQQKKIFNAESCYKQKHYPSNKHTFIFNFCWTLWT